MTMLPGRLLLLCFLPLISGAGLQSLVEIQVKNEFLASNVYLTFAHRLATRGVYHGFANFFYESAEEEREHGKKLIDFYNARNRDLLLYSIDIDDEIAATDDLVKMIFAAAKLEQQVYDSLINVRLQAHNDKDYPTVHFIEQVMLEEQTVALKYMSDLVERIKRHLDNPTILLQMMDQDLRKKQIKKP